MFVLVLITSASPAKTAEPRASRFGMRTCVDPRNSVLDASSRPLKERATFEGVRPTEKHENLVDGSKGEPCGNG